MPDASDSIAAVLARLQSVAAELAVTDGVSRFNHLYLEVTQAVDTGAQGAAFEDPAFLKALDVSFAGLYFNALAAAAAGSALPRCWAPLFAARSDLHIAPIQFALAGMNAHINHDLPLAVVTTCAALGTAPDASPHFADYQKVDTLLDAAEQAIRESFETGLSLDVDRHLAAVADLLGNWTINSARDLAWNNCLLLWAIRDNPLARGLFLDSLAASTAAAGRLLLVSV
jgi:uncharacterized protein DUF5995